MTVKCVRSSDGFYVQRVYDIFVQANILVTSKVKKGVFYR